MADTSTSSQLSASNRNEQETTMVKTAGDDDNDCEESRHFLVALQLVEQGLIPLALKAAVELGVFEIIDRAGLSARLSPREIAAQLPECCNPEAPVMLDRVLRLLTTNSVVTCSVERGEEGGVERRYGLGPLGKFFVSDENGGSLAPYLSLVQKPVDIECWNKFGEAVLEGGVALNKVYGVNVFENEVTGPDTGLLFDEAMSKYSTIIMHKLLQKYQGFESINQIVDVGGGLGHAVHAIISKYPSIRGINFDLPRVVSNAHKLYPGVEHIGGDMFETIPQGDAIFMKCVLHDWDDERCLKILKNCYKAVPENGKVIVVDAINTDVPETTAVAKVVSRMDVCMMAINGGAKERTSVEFLCLVKAAGFAGINIVCRVFQFWVMEFYK